MSGSGQQECVVRATSLASDAEELFEEGHWLAAATKFEEAAEAYIRATLHTTDSRNVQALRQLALAHSQRSHELRLRAKIHGVLSGGGIEGIGIADAKSATRGSASAETIASNSALGRLGSQLVHTHEELRVGADDLARLLAACAGGGSMVQGVAGSVLMGGKLIDSFCVVPSQHSAASRGARFTDVLPSQQLQQSMVGSGGVCTAAPSSSPAGSEGPRSSSASLETERGTELHPSMAQLMAENGRLARENAALRQREIKVGPSSCLAPLPCFLNTR